MKKLNVQTKPKHDYDYASNVIPPSNIRFNKELLLDIRNNCDKNDLNKQSMLISYKNDEIKIIFDSNKDNLIHEYTIDDADWEPANAYPNEQH